MAGPVQPEVQGQCPEKKAYFPLFVPTAGRRVLVVGGGLVAQRRVQTLLGFEFGVHLVSPKATGELADLAARGEINWQCRPFEESDLSGGWALVLLATDDRALNRRAGQLARSLGIPVNVADCKEACDFFFPAVVTAGSLVVGLAADGRDHKLVKAVAGKLRQVIKEDFLKEGTGHED